MSTLGLVYNVASSAGGEQLMLLRTLQDNDRNLVSTRPCLQNKNNLSVINLSSSALAEQQPNKSNGQALPAYDPSRLKKHGKNGQPPPVAVAKRNARERNRVKQVNNGFATLRQHIPSHVAQCYGDRGKKLSKVETLRMAVEYIRGLQRLLAEADGVELVDPKLRNTNNDSSVMIPSPSGSVYSNSTHNGSADVFRLDEQQQQDIELTDADGDELTEDEPMERRPPTKRFRDQQSTLSENQQRERCRRREDDLYYSKQQQVTFGDEENIEPLVNRIIINNNNNNSNSNNNNVLSSFSPILVQSPGASSNVASIKREVQLIEEDESRPSSSEDDSANHGVILASSSPYTGEIYIENPETGRLVPLKIEEHEAAQLVYVTTTTDPAFYKSELTDGTAELSWWDQECVVQQMQQQQQLQQQQQQQQQQQALQPTQRTLAHV